MGLSIGHIIIIAVVVFLLFGAKKLPEIGTGLGQAITNFRKAYRAGTTIDVTPDRDDKKDS